MPYTKRYLKNTLWDQFSFFHTGDPDVGGDVFDTDLNIDGAFRLAEIRVKFSGVCSADIILRAYLSSIEGTAFTVLFLSYTLNNSIYYRWEPSTVPMFCQSGDTVQISCITDNVWSCNVVGWSVTAVR